MRKVAFIPARKGSKRLPFKNFLEIAGKPLYRWTLDAAVKSGVFDEIIVSSDNEEVVKQLEGVGQGCVRVAMRPKEFSGDDVTVVQALINFFGESEDFCCIVLLPTCPLRGAEDIKSAVRQFEASQIDSLISAEELHLGREFVFCPAGEAPVIHIGEEVASLKNTQSQGSDSCYVPNGAIFISRYLNLRKKKTFYSGMVGFFTMNKGLSIDIDHKEDLQIANLILRGLDEFNRLG